MQMKDGINNISEVKLTRLSKSCDMRMKDTIQRFLACRLENDGIMKIKHTEGRTKARNLGQV